MGHEADDKELHPGHRSIRFPEYDYSAAGFYFVTICTYEKNCVLGTLREEYVELSEIGKLVRKCWTEIPKHFVETKLHEFVVMPNHMHGIVEIVAIGAQHAAPIPGDKHDLAGRPRVQSGSLRAIVRSHKAAVTRLARRQLAWSGEVWQRNYFERVLRDGQEIADAARYILENPMRWKRDIENPGRKEQGFG